MRKPPRESAAPNRSEPDARARLPARPVCFSAAQGFIETAIYLRERLSPGNRIAGPALIEEHASTTVLMPGDALTVDAFGNLDISVGGGK